MSLHVVCKILVEAAFESAIDCGRKLDAIVEAHGVVIDAGLDGVVVVALEARIEAGREFTLEGDDALEVDAARL